MPTPSPCSLLRSSARPAPPKSHAAHAQGGERSARESSLAPSAVSEREYAQTRASACDRCSPLRSCARSAKPSPDPAQSQSQSEGRGAPHPYPRPCVDASRRAALPAGRSGRRRRAARSELSLSLRRLGAGQRVLGPERTVHRGDRLYAEDPRRDFGLQHVAGAARQVVRNVESLAAGPLADARGSGPLVYARGSKASVASGSRSLIQSWGRVGRGVIGGFSSPMPPRPTRPLQSLRFFKRRSSV